MIWLPVALEQIRRLDAAHAEWTGPSSGKLSQAIFDRETQLAMFPGSGRMIPEFQMEHLRELLEQEFRVLYEVFHDRVEVFGVVPAKRDPFGE